MAARVAVYGGFQNPKRQMALYHVRRAQANAMTEKGFATWIGRSQIQLNKAPISSLHCGQESVYERSAIEMHPKYSSGGLNRTETKPAPFSRFKAARVGHQ